MVVLTMDKAQKRKKIARFSMLVALIVCAVSIYMMITGEYASLEERKSADALYTTLALGSILYIAVLWITCVMSKPFWFPGGNK